MYFYFLLFYSIILDGMSYSPSDVPGSYWSNVMHFLHHLNPSIQKGNIGMNSQLGPFLRVSWFIILQIKIFTKKVYWWFFVSFLPFAGFCSAITSTSRWCSIDHHRPVPCSQISDLWSAWLPGLYLLSDFSLDITRP